MLNMLGWRCVKEEKNKGKISTLIVKAMRKDRKIAMKSEIIREQKLINFFIIRVYDLTYSINYFNL